MRTVNLYYVYDNINELAITSLIPAANDLVAAIGFRDSYITNEEYKKKVILRLLIWFVLLKLILRKMVSIL